MKIGGTKIWGNVKLSQPEEPNLEAGESKRGENHASILTGPLEIARERMGLGHCRKAVLEKRP